MARLEELLKEVADLNLRSQLEAEVSALKNRTRFGLVYEKHLPETVMVGDIDGLRAGDHVRPREEADNGHDYRVVELNRDAAIIDSLNGAGQREARLSDLLMVRRFSDPADAGLTPLGSIAGSSDRPYHAVINGENFHALQALTFALEGQVDCIYIDPPYNSGASDWKYNNRFVDSTDAYRHSKWLSFMEKRLKLAKRLLRPDGVLIVTIDENELTHLGVLLEQLFPDYLRYLVTIVINPKGTSKANFARVEEYAFYVVPDTGYDLIPSLPAAEDRPEYEPNNEFDDDEAPHEDESGGVDQGVLMDVSSEHAAIGEMQDGPIYSVLYLRRRGAESSARTDRPRQFYAIEINERTREVIAIGPELGPDDPYQIMRSGDILTIYPVDGEGNERVWRYGRDTMQHLIDRGEIRVGRYNKQLDTYTLNHWKPVPKERAGFRRVRTVWWRTAHDAGTHGTTLLTNLLGKRNVFPFPKSLYAVRDCLQAVVGDRPNATIVDFFAGSGTTLHATCLLNADDGGGRRCILVTNNEVDAKTAADLNSRGIFRGDPEFEAHGIFEAVTKPRVMSAIGGCRPDGSAFPPGRRYQYLGGRAFADGFEENVEFFRLDYLDGDQVELGQCFESIHPLLWLAAGARGRPPDVASAPDFLVASDCGYAVLLEEERFREFEEELAGHEEITHVFIVTDDEDSYARMRERVGVGRDTTMLYRDFLQHYRRHARI